MLKQVTKWPSDWVTEWPSDQVTKWQSDQVTEWLGDRKLRRRLTVWYIFHLYLYYFASFLTKCQISIYYLPRWWLESLIDRNNSACSIHRAFSSDCTGSSQLCWHLIFSTQLNHAVYEVVFLSEVSSVWSYNFKYESWLWSDLIYAFCCSKQHLCFIGTTWELIGCWAICSWTCCLQIYHVFDKTAQASLLKVLRRLSCTYIGDFASCFYHTVP